ncbi:MAG: prolyl oligopeptidase family serine peptidase, partial [Tahibacter sp.]
GHLAALAGTSGNDSTLEGSVGGHATVSSRVQAVVDYYGPVDLLQLNPDVTTPPGSALNHDAPSAPGSLLIGFSATGQGLGVLRANAENPNSPFPMYRALAQAANPINFIDAEDPPFLIVHGTADPQVAIRQSERLRDALRVAGHDPAFIAVPGAGHGEFPSSVQQSAIDFLATTLTATPIAVGNPAALAGAWFDPLSSGQGFEVQWIQGNVLLVFFFGHRNDGNNLFLIGTHVGAPRYGETLEMDMTVTRGGRFTDFDAAAVHRESWGTLRLRLDSCERGTASMSGADGNQTLALVRLVRPAGASCD